MITYIFIYKAQEADEVSSSSEQYISERGGCLISMERATKSFLFSFYKTQSPLSAHALHLIFIN